MEPILGRPMICRQLERVGQSERLDAVIVATSTDPSDDPIASTMMSENVPCFRGDLDDVLDRVYQAALASNVDQVVRLTADCPLVDARIIDALVEMHLAENRDYSSNFLDRRYPDGIDAEIVSIEALEVAWREATESSDREHVTPYLYRHPKRFNLGSLRCERNLAAQRWTVDHREDLDFV
ncbi:MAG: cytidylyltransferase domain-containing protein, partial [Gammaproteobacteria bacterium]